MLPERGERVKTSVNLPMMGDENGPVLILTKSEGYEYPRVPKGSVGTIISVYNQEDEHCGQAVLTVRWEVGDKKFVEDVFTCFAEVL